METRQLLDVLGVHPFFETIEPHHIDRLAGMADEVRFERDEMIFQEGDTSASFYVLVSGKVALETRAQRQTVRIQTLTKGDELGWSSVLASGGKRFQARALTAVRALSFDGMRLRQACQDDPKFGVALMRRIVGLIAQRLAATRLQLMDVLATGEPVPQV